MCIRIAHALPVWWGLCNTQPVPNGAGSWWVGCLGHCHHGRVGRSIEPRILGACHGERSGGSQPCAVVPPQASTISPWVQGITRTLPASVGICPVLLDMTWWLGPFDSIMLYFATLPASFAGNPVVYKVSFFSFSLQFYRRMQKVSTRTASLFVWMQWAGFCVAHLDVSVFWASCFRTAWVWLWREDWLNG